MTGGYALAGARRACCVIFSLDRTSVAAVSVRAEATGEMLAMKMAVIHSMIVGALLIVMPAASAQTDPVKCQKEVVKNLAKYKKTYLKAVSKCLDAKNAGKLPPNTSCPDAAANQKISKVALQAPEKVAAKCSLADLTTTLGFRS